MNWNVFAAFVGGMIVGPTLLIAILALFACVRRDDDLDDVSGWDASNHELGIGANG